MSIDVIRIATDGNVTEHDISGRTDWRVLDNIYDLLDCTTVDAFTVSGIIVWADDEGMLKDNPVVNRRGTDTVAFLAAGDGNIMAQELYGHLLFTCRDEEGRTVSLTPAARVVLERAIRYADTP